MAAFLSVSIPTQINAQDVDDSIFEIDRIEQTEFADAVAPGVRREIAQLFGIGAEEGFLL